MAIYYYTSPGITVTPTPSAALTSAYFGSQDVYITYQGAILYGKLGSPAGKIATSGYDLAIPFIGITGGFFSGSGSNPPVVPSVTSSVLIQTTATIAGQVLNFTPVFALGGTAVASTASNKSALTVTLDKILPSGLTLYTSKTNIVASTVKPTQTGSGTTDVRVTYNITSNIGILPVVGQFYAVRGQTKVTYNGIWECTAVTPTSVTLKYNADPSTGGGVPPGSPAGQIAWSTSSVTTIRDSDVYALQRTDGSTNKDWYNYTAVTVIGTPKNEDVGTKTYTVTFTDAKGQSSSASFALTINPGAADLSYTLDISSRTLIQGVADSFKPLNAANGITPYTYSIVSPPSLPAGLLLIQQPVLFLEHQLVLVVLHNIQ